MALRDSLGSTSLLAAAIIFGALILTWNSSTPAPHYALAASGNAIVRLDTESGAMISCDQQICHQIEAAAPSKTLNPLTNVFRNVKSNVEQREIEDQAKKK